MIKIGTVFFLFGLLMVITACNTLSPTQTPDVNAAYTEVAQTFEARRTQEAALTPSSTPTLEPTLTPSATSTPSITDTPAPTATIVVPTNTTLASGSDKCAYISQNIADNSVFTPGAPVSITWSLKNIGTSSWTTDYKIRFYAGTIMGAPNEIALPAEVKPEETANINLNLVAPNTPETYNTIWVLTSSPANGSVNFCSFNLVIKVSN